MSRRTLGVGAVAVGLAWACGLATARGQQDGPDLRRQLEAERAELRAFKYRADVRKAARLAEAGSWPAAGALLDAYRPAAGGPDPRSWEWHYLDALRRKAQLVDRRGAVVQGQGEGFRRLAWSGDGRRLAAVAADGSVILWDLETGKPLRQLGGARGVSWDRDGQRLAVSSVNRTVTLWPADPGPARRFFGPVPDLPFDRQPAFRPDGQRLALAVEKTAVAVVDADFGRPLQRLEGHRDAVTAVAWSPDGQSLATGGNDGTVRLWDAATGRESAALEAAGRVEGLAWAAGGAHLAAATVYPKGSGQVVVWDVARRAAVFRAEATYGGSWSPDLPRAGLSVSPDGRRVAAESARGLTVWETATGRPFFQGPTGLNASRLGACDPQVTRWAFLTMSGTRAACRVVDVATSAELYRFETEIPVNRYQAALAWSPDGRRLAAGFSDGKIQVLGVPSGPAESRLVDTGPSSLFEWAPGGGRYAYASQGELFVGSVPAGAPAVRLGSPLLVPTVFAMSPDGRYLAGAERDGTLPVWDVDSGQIARRLPGHPAPLERGANPSATALVWSPDGRRLASLRHGDGGVSLWEAASGRLVTSLVLGPSAFDGSQTDAPALAWSPDGSLVALRAGVPGRRIMILEADTGRRLQAWDGGPPPGSWNAMAWDPDGRRLATCLGNPPRLQLWDARAGTAGAPLDAPVSGTQALTWSPDGRRLAYLGDGCGVVDLESRRVRPVAGKWERLAWSPDGRRLALVLPAFGGGEVLVVDAATGQPVPGVPASALRPDPAVIRERTKGSEGSNFRDYSVAWGPRGLRAAASATAYPGMGMLVAWDMATARPLLTVGQVYDALGTRSRVARLVSWSPDGRTLAALSSETSGVPRVDLWDATTAKRLTSFDAGRVNTDGAAALGWSPDGRRLAFAGESVLVWDVAGAEVKPARALRTPAGKGPKSERTYLAWSGDGGSLAVLECRHTSGHEQVITAWDVNSGRERFRWSRPYERGDARTALAWSPDGRRLLWGGFRPAVWDVSTGAEAFALTGHGDEATEVAWSPDGRRVIARSTVFTGLNPQFELAVWDADGAEELLALRGPPAGWLLAPDFQSLATPPGRGSDPGDVLVWDLRIRASAPAPVGGGGK